GLITGPFDDGITARAAEAEAARLAIADAGLRRDQVDGAIQLRRTGGGGERASFADAFPRILGLPFKFFYTIGRGGALAGLAIAVQTRAWACRNPRAKMYGRPITVEDHQASPLYVEPYHLLDICLVSDGAVAFILTTAERARDLAKPPVYVLGLGMGEVADTL